MDRRTHLIVFFSGLIAGALIAGGMTYHLIGRAERAAYKEGYAAGQGSGTQVQGASASATGANGLPVPTGASFVKLTHLEVTKHNNPASCWLLIGGKIYDATPYIEAHPGGAAEILANCGTDATTAFASKGAKGAPHSPEASAMLGSLLIGVVDQEVPASAISVASGGTATPTPAIPRSKGGDDDDDEREFEDD